MEPQVLIPSSGPKSLRALVVDDMAVNRQVLRGFLRAEGIAVIEVGSASEALVALERAAFDLVILDLELEPGADGFLVLDMIRRRRELDLMPVILVSGHRVDSPSVERGLSSGADDYVTRPVAPEVLRARIRSAVRSRARVLGLHREASTAARSAAKALELLREASEVQRATLPSVPLEVAHVGVTGAVIPAASVAGDAFDVVVDDRGAVSVCLFDAAGHGPASGLVVSASRQVVRSALEQGQGFPSVLGELERCLSTHIGCVEAAVALGIVRFSASGSEVEVLNAGLPPIASQVPGQGQRFFESTSLPIGLAPAGSADFRRVPAEPGTTWLLVSDGATAGELGPEPVRAVATRAGLDRHGESLARAEPHVIEALIREILFMDPGHHDDATVVLAHFPGRRAS